MSHVLKVSISVIIYLISKNSSSDYFFKKVSELFFFYELNITLYPRVCFYKYFNSRSLVELFSVVFLFLQGQVFYVLIFAFSQRFLSHVVNIFCMKARLIGIGSEHGFSQLLEMYN